MNFQKKLVLVTGGGSGIGLAIVRELLNLGAYLVVLDKAFEPLDEALKGTSVYGAVHPVQVDVGSRTDIDRVFSEQRLTPVDILINNAGIDEPFSVLNPDWESWDRVMRTNLDGSIYLTGTVVKRSMVHRPGSSIIFVSSVMAECAYRVHVSYGASKAALVQVMKNLAYDLGPHGIRVNAVSPGFIYPTGITGHLSADQAKRLGNKVPLLSHGRPEDVAKACAFLASDDAAYITGVNLRVDGGFCLPGAFAHNED